MNEKKKLDELKNLVGDDVFDSIVSTGKSLEAKAKKQGLKFKEGKTIMLTFEEWQKQKAEYKEYEAFVAKQSASADVELSDDELDALIAEVEADVVEEKAMDYKAMASELYKMLKPMLEGSRKRDEDEKGKELTTDIVVDVSGFEELRTTIKEMQAKIDELSQPVAPANMGYRPSLQHDPQELGAQHAQQKEANLDPFALAAAQLDNSGVSHD